MKKLLKQQKSKIHKLRSKLQKKYCSKRKSNKIVHIFKQHAKAKKSIVAIQKVSNDIKISKIVIHKHVAEIKQGSVIISEQKKVIKRLVHKKAPKGKITAAKKILKVHVTKVKKMKK